MFPVLVMLMANFGARTVSAAVVDTRSGRRRETLQSMRDGFEKRLTHALTKRSSNYEVLGFYRDFERS